MDLPDSLRRTIYDITLERGAPPCIAELSAVHETPPDCIADALDELARSRVVVLQPASGELLMVPPFSAVPTPFVVETVHYQTYANCGWDALGVPVMLRQEAHVVTSCGCCSELIALEVNGRVTPAGAAVLHFAVPARLWWDNIAFT